MIRFKYAIDLPRPANNIKGERFISTEHGFAAKASLAFVKVGYCGWRKNWLNQSQPRPERDRMTRWQLQRVSGSAR